MLRKITEEGKILTNLYLSFSADQFTKPEIFPSLRPSGMPRWSRLHGYAKGEKVRQLCSGTRLHCIVMQFCGWELIRMEEVWGISGSILAAISLSRQEVRGVYALMPSLCV